MKKSSSNDLPINKKKYPYVTPWEREMDFIVVEEIFSSPDFQNWLLTKLDEEESSELIGAWKNVSPANYGECDIVIEFIINDKKIAILIEDKIDAPEQPKQAERYHKTGKFLVEKGEVDRYITCLLAPMDYFKEGAPMEKYDKTISHEELLEWFEKQDDSKRMRFKQMVLENGITKAKTSWVRNPNEKTDNFYKYYEELARQIKPELAFRYKGYTGGNSWLYIKPGIFPANIIIVHKGDRGYVDLEISKIDRDEFTKTMESKLKDKMTIQKTGKSVSVRITVSLLPKTSTVEAPEMYREKIEEALNAASQLMEWYLDFKNEPVFR